MNSLPFPATDGLDFQSLMAAHRGILLKIAASYCRLPDDRADLAQEMSLQLWRAWPSFEPGRRFSTWMYRIALNVAISQLRRQPDAHETLDEEHSQLVGAQDVDAEQRERMALVQAAMQSLGALDRALLVLHLEGCSHRESGEVLGISEGNVATRLGRIKQQLRRLSGDQDKGDKRHGND
jgi:RNA polymerase sigma-70 factor (ECF subfamily)